MEHAASRIICFYFFFFSSRRRHTRLQGDWSSDVCSSDLVIDQTHRYSGGSSTDTGSAPVIHHQSNRREGVPDVAMKLRVPFQLLHVAPVVARLPVRPGN